jgi:DNA polymerase-4
MNARQRRKIIHIDMDCFYAAVEEKYNPIYKGRPLAVGGPPQSRAVICTANYEARKFGVKAAVPSSRAVKLCPQLILVPPRFDLYRLESKKIREIFRSFTPNIEPLSLDEAYLDVTDCQQFQGSATLIAQEIRRQIFQETGLTASAGIAPNKFLAKIASDWKKPNGQFVIRPDQIDAFMPSLKIEKIFGVGKVTAKKMHEKNIFTCGDLQKLGLLQLKRYFGSSRAHELFHLSRGVDERKVVSSWERKSLTVEETFSKDLSAWSEIEQEIGPLYEEWVKRIDKGFWHEKIKGLVVKIKYHDFKASTHEMSWSFQGEMPDEKQFQKLFYTAWSKRPEAIRLMGLGARLSEKKTGLGSEDSDQLQFDVASGF